MLFTKMHGTGNDYIYINLFPSHEDSVAAGFENNKLTTIEGHPITDIIISISDRHFGIGSDGLIAIAPPSDENADVRMIMFNADGSEGAMCGNGIRCVAKYAWDTGLVKNSKEPKMRIETASGIKELTLTVKDGICTHAVVDMGQAILAPSEIPVNLNIFEKTSSNPEPEKLVSQSLTVNGKEYSVTCVSMGNPHCVIFTENIDELELDRIGPFFENHKAFPDRINTEFVEVINDHTLKMRVWERGSGETISCGTGSCAVTVAAALNGHVPYDTEIEVQLRGGNLYDTYSSDGQVFMRGPATKVFTGEIILDNPL